MWASQSNSAKPAAEVQHTQKAWDAPVAANHRALLLARAVSDVDTARLLAACSSHAGDWLHALPITAVGLRLSDEAIRVAVANGPKTLPCGIPLVTSHYLEQLRLTLTLYFLAFRIFFYPSNNTIP